MKRLHVSVSVADIDTSVRFYSFLFGVAPTLRRPDYAKWMLDDPRVNFTIEARGRTPGVDHLGIQVEDAAELRELYGRMEAAEAPMLEVGETVCCYARSEKSWAADPQGVLWEAFLTTTQTDVYGDDSDDALRTNVAGSMHDPCCAGPRR